MMNLCVYISKSLKAIDGPYSNQIKAIIKKEIKVLMYSIINNLYLGLIKITRDENSFGKYKLSVRWITQ